jgi:hypothetical protein
MDLEVAEWLAELVQEAVAAIAERPGLTVEVDDVPSNWVQIIPEADLIVGNISGFSLNFPFRDTKSEPASYLQSAALKLPPDSNITSWSHGSHMTLWVRPDIPLIALALLTGDILEKIGGAAAGYEINVQILHSL